MFSFRSCLLDALVLLVARFVLCSSALCVEVTLESPADGSVVNNATVSFTCSAFDGAGLSTATLYIGNQPQTVLFSGPDETDDAQIYAGSPGDPDTNYGTATSINVDGENPHAHAVIKFLNVFGDVPGQVPPGSSIVSATLGINCFDSGAVMWLYRLTEDWAEGEVTWNARTSSLSWTNPGGDGAGSNAGVPLEGDCTSTGWRTIDITSFVQEWSSGAPNYGIVLTDTGTDGVDFDSSEAATPPVLTITYQTQWLSYGTEPMSGTSDTVTFAPVLLTDQQDYVWNCLVANVSGAESWATADSRLRVDTNVPNQPILVEPSDGATGVDTSPALQVTVSDPQGDALDVSFYGSSASGGDEFTIIALPDTQKYVLNGAYPEIFTSQTQWIVDNVATHHIVFVTHEGDIVDTWDNTTEWSYANTSMSILDGVVPYGVLPGNHDMSSTGITTYYNETFPYTRYDGQPWYGAHHPTTGNDNNYELFSAGGDDYIIVHLQYAPTSDVFDWANGVLAANADRKAIITTHDYMETSGARSTNGENIWTNVVVPNANVYFVLCGHNHDEATRSDWVGDRQVHQLLADYQGRENGGNGWLRIMTFVPAEETVYVQTYSPWLDQYETDANSQFTLSFPMTGYSLIGTNEGVLSGSDTSIVWPGLSVSTLHEWYVTVTDPTGRTQVGPRWQFTTASNDITPPSLSDVDAVDITHNSARIVWSTDELSDSVVEYDTDISDSSYDFQACDLSLVMSHSIPLTDLDPQTLYHYRVSSKDGAGNVAYSADQTFTTLPYDEPPVAMDDAYSVDEDSALSIPAPGVLGNDYDPEGKPLAAVLATQPSHGTLVLGSNGSFTYTPDADFNGADSFGYKANDGLLDSAEATVAITVDPVNDPPMAVDDAYSVEQDGLLDVAAPGVLGNDSDVDGDALTAVLLSEPSHGTLSLGGDGSFAYTPDGGYSGSDSFSYKANDGIADSNMATVTVAVNPVNYDAYVSQDPIVSFGTVGGNGIAGTTAAGDGLVQTITEAPNGKAGMASMQAEYVLHTRADPAQPTELVFYLAAAWTAQEADDPLMVSIWDGAGWQDITADILEDGVFAPGLGSENYVDADGNIHVLFTDTAAIKKEKKDTLTIDLLYAHIVVGPPPDVHDVAVPAIAAPGSVLVGETATIDVTVENQGTYDESFDVVLTDDGSGATIGTQPVSLAAGACTAVSFSWETTSETLGDHTLTATAGPVTDEADTADNSGSTTVTVSEAGATMHVAIIDMALSTRSAGPNTFVKALATVCVVDADGYPVSGAAVYGSWSGATSDTDSASTGSDGNVTLESDELKNPASGTTFTFTVDNVVLQGWTYDPTGGPTEGSVIVP
jgi:hypothetical protein